MPKFQNLDKWRRPELFLAEVLNKGARGQYREEDENIRIWWRATVVAVDVFGGKLENDDGSGELEHIIDGRSVRVPANIGPANPRNSIKARIITDGFDQFVGDKDLRVFWPMMPEHDSIPIKPGEHVYVTFEDPDFEHGLWFGKVSGHQGVNFFSGESAFVGRDRDINDAFASSESADESASNDKIAGDRLVSRDLNKLLDGDND